MPLHGFPLPRSDYYTNDSYNAPNQDDPSRELLSEGSSYRDIKLRTYHLLHYSLACPDAPWFDSPGGITVIPRFIEDRLWDEASNSGTYGEPPWEVRAEGRRTIIWGVVAMAKSEKVADEILFSSSGAGKSFTLKCPGPFHTPVPYQRMHFGPWAIPDELADKRCADLNIQELVDILNGILGTRYSLLDTPGLSTCLERIASECEDFGELYGFMRPWWHGDFRKVQEELARQKAEDDELREKALEGDSITNPYIPPRRVWDLYSNRVVPFHVLSRDPKLYWDGVGAPNIPKKLWTVSHGWLDAKDRQDVWTPINGMKWPVPIPRQTTLAHVRIELLNMGAEWIWMDVLCLRQRGNDEDEQRRKDEWRLDVPSIGHVYQPEHNGVQSRQTCVTYFNGLGIPFDCSMQKAWINERHWLNRAWTLQEACLGWLPGGMTGAEISEGPLIFSEMRIIQKFVNRDELFRVAHTMQNRSSSNKVDKIAGIGYILQCPTLPVYNEDTTLELAWSFLVRHLHPRVRTDLFIMFPEPGESSWYPSWTQLTQGPRYFSPSQELKTFRISDFKPEEYLKYDANTTAYFHRTRHFFEDCNVNRIQGDGGVEYTTSVLYGDFNLGQPWSIPRRQYQFWRFQLTSDQTFLPDGAYTLLSIGDLWYWLVARKLGTRDLHGETVVELEKMGVFCIESDTRRDEISRWTAQRDERLFTYR